MKLKEFDILLDIKRNKKVEYIEVVQGDYNTNKLNIKLIDGVEDYNLSGLNVEIAFAKSDGTTVVQDKNNGINILDNKIECILTTNTIASPSRVLAEVRIMEGTKVLTSARFEFFVKKAIVNDETIASTNEFPILQELTDNVKGVIATEAARVTAENVRKTNEISRVNAENGRVSAENNRATTFGGYETRVSTVETDLTTYMEDYIQQRSQDQLKVAKVEKDINDYQSTMATINPNQEAKQKVSGYGTISLPKNAANGQVSVSVKGETRKNLLTNDSIKWQPGAILDTGAITPNPARIRTDFIDIEANKQYSMYVTPNYSISTINFYSGASFISRVVPTSNLQTFTAPANTTTIRVVIQFANNATIATNDIVNAYPVLELGAVVGNFITGTKSTISSSRLKSVGKNVFNGKLDNASISMSTGEYIRNQPLASASKTLIPIKPSTVYTLSIAGVKVSANLIYYDLNKKFITSNGSSSTLSLSNCYYVSFWRSTTGDLTIQYQLEEGTVATPYEPYTESTQYLPNVGELRSLPSGTKDEVRVSQGKAELIKRVSDDYILKSSDILNIRTELSNIDYAVINLNLDISSLPIGDVVYIPSMPRGWINTNTMNSVENIGKWGGLNTINKQIAIALSKGATLEQAKTQLAGLELTYQLAEPIITPIEVSGTLLSNPSGTVYVENVVADAGTYTTKFDIKELQLPIKSIDKLIKYNFTTGVQTVLDTSLAVINADKKSFTHPNLTDKDMVFVDYFYDVEGTLGETTIEYYDSRHTIKDSVNNKFYKWDIKSANGVPTVSLTEVL